MSTGSARVARPLTPLALIALLAGGVVGLVLAPGIVSLLRERLHHQCSGGAPGTEAAGWVCADGIGYLLPVVGLAGVCGIAVIAALLVLTVGREPGPVRRGLAVIAVLTVGVGIGATWLATSDPREVPPGESRTGYWVEAVLPAAVVLVVALALVLAGLRAGRTGRVLTLGGAAGIVVATVLEPGLGVTTIPALGMLLASAAVGVPPE